MKYNEILNFANFFIMAAKNLDSSDLILFKNYDLYENSTGPGAGYTSLLKFKSVKDFLKHNRKNKKRIKKADSANQMMLTPIPFDSPVSVSGLYDYTPSTDLDNKSVDNLNYGRDYQDSYSKIDELISKYLSVAESPLYGIPGGIDPSSHVEDDLTHNKNQYFGTLNNQSNRFKNFVF